MPPEPPKAPGAGDAGPAPARRRVLSDESVPHDLAAAIVGHDVATVQGLGWAGTKDGPLLRSAWAAGFEVLVTTDRNMRYQQNIPASRLALVVLRARSTRVPDLLALLPALQTALPGARAGTVTQLRAA